MKLRNPRSLNACMIVQRLADRLLCGHGSRCVSKSQSIDTVGERAGIELNADARPVVGAGLISVGEMRSALRY